jgi:hypothetical protein
MEIVENTFEVVSKSSDITISKEDEPITDLSIEMIVEEFQYLEIFS